MIYSDVRCALPSGPGIRISLTPSRTPGVSYVVLYRGKSRRGKDGRTVHDRVTIGKTVLENGEQVFHPNDQYFKEFKLEPPQDGKRIGCGRPRRSAAAEKMQSAAPASDLWAGAAECSAFVLAVRKEAGRLGLRECLQQSFGFELSSQILNLAVYFLFEGPKPDLALLEHFAARQLGLPGSLPGSEQAPDLFERIGCADIKLFFERWIASHQGQHCVLYAPGLYTAGSAAASWRAELLPGLILDAPGSLPLFYTQSSESCGVPLWHSVLQQAREKGLACPEVTVVSAGVWADDHAQDAIREPGVQLLAELSPDDEAARAALLMWKEHRDYFAEVEAAFDSAVLSHEEPFRLKHLVGRLIMFEHVVQETLETMALRLRLKAAFAHIKEHQGCFTEKPPAQLFEFCSVSEKEQHGQSAFLLQPDNAKIGQLLELCGSKLLFTTDPKLSHQQCWEFCRQAEICRQAFAGLKSESIGGRIRLYSQEAHRGRCFIAFIALILHLSLQRTLSGLPAGGHLSLYALWVLLSEVRCRRGGAARRSGGAADGRISELLQALGLPCDFAP
ncbi:MAG: hypothetical protein IAB19_01095 [Proteobacteria bacterium]|uniref:Transposase IS4-like domain-containing protein n=1 Tax=Candidatus Avisuccinivibrio stercorigallinarum TaxID=2840704 RepID=A0A9D9DAS4_9GAMM|nr:hypothetical protein [Candidatus Avisuccinivibrio stercorigallinarum]